MLVAGLLYLGRYKDQLIIAEIQAMEAQARMYAGAVAAVVVAPLDVRSQIVSRQVAREVVRRLTGGHDIRARLFAPSGRMVADSETLKRNNRFIGSEPLPSLTGSDESWGEILRKPLESVLKFLIPEAPLPQIPDPGIAAADFEEVRHALAGTAHAAVYDDPGGLVINVVVPVQRFKRVLGAIMLTKQDGEIEYAMQTVRLDILKYSSLAFAITVLLSLYLAGTIARPLKRLALAAERVRGARTQRHAIPDLTRRGDEIGELSGVLREMTDALWARMDAIERFAADVAHEIKNPLTSLRSAVETATRLKDPERQRRLMEIIAEDVKRLDRLISDISDYSRMDAEMSRADPEEVDLKLMLETLCNVNDCSGPNNVRVTVSAEDNLRVEAVEGRLGQVLQNLLVNAISFSPVNGEVRLHARPLPSGEEAEIIVEDDGPGIRDGREEKIFDRFYSERPDGEKFGQHSGLGLAISRQIARALGGELRAENRLQDGRVLGARFVLTLKTTARRARPARETA